MSNIMSKSELEIRMKSPEITRDFLKSHKIGEHTKQGELLAQLHDELVNAFIYYHENTEN